MKTRGTTCVIVALTGVMFASSPFAQTTAFTYQGRLTDSGSPVNGFYDFECSLFGVAEDGVAVAGPLSTGTAVSNGLFTVALDFGSGVFDGTPRWLEIGLRTNGGGGFTVLAPRTELTAAPYALYAPSAGVAVQAGSVSGPVPAHKLTGTIPPDSIGPGSIDRTMLDDEAVGSDQLDTEVLQDTFWRMDGNAGIVPGTHFLGTTDNQPLEFRVNNEPGLRLEYSTQGRAPNIRGGHGNNAVGSLTEGAVVAGGGASGSPNTIGADSDYGVVGGGGGNDIADTAKYGTIAGGYNNNIGAGSWYATIAGGSVNDIGVNSDYGAVGGGRDNDIADNASHTVIAGGYLNDIGVNSDYGAVGGGFDNNIASNAQYAVITGGEDNDIGVSANWSAVGGGGGNRIADDARSATIAGGVGNTIGVNSDYGVVGGGSGNDIADEARVATIAGGLGNTIGVNSDRSAVGGGSENNIASNAQYAVIAGGSDNIIEVNADWSVVGGGDDNSIADDVQYAVIAGGRLNGIGANSDYGAVGGGFDNNIASNAQYATIAGGSGNDIGAGTSYAYAAGRRARADHSGTFVWADSTDASFPSIADDEFAVRASSGMRVVGSTTMGALTVAPNRSNNGDDSQLLLAEDDDGTFGMLLRYDGGNNELQIFGKSGATTYGPHLVIDRDNSNVGIGRFPSLNALEVAGAASKTTAGTWLANSDARIKQNVQPIAGALDKLARVRLVSFQYTDDYRAAHPGVEDRSYLNVVAQEFAEVFPEHVKGSGETLPDGSEILQVDTYPLTIYSAAAIQELQRENAGLRQRLARLERLVEQLDGGAQ